MHDHNNNGNRGHKGMMWMMLICCTLPFVVLFLGGGTAFTGGYLLPGLIMVLILVHLWMMFRRHGDKDQKS